MMIRLHLRIAVLINAAFCLTVAVAQSRPPSRAPERRDFIPSYGDGSFDDYDPPSDELLKVLLESEEVKGALEHIDHPDREWLRARFQVVEIHLANPAERDYLVLGQDPISGADCDWFWIVRSLHNRLETVLFENTNEITLLNRKRNGLRSIRSAWCSAAFCMTRYYRFDGQRYSLSRKIERPQVP